MEVPKKRAGGLNLLDLLMILMGTLGMLAASVTTPRKNHSLVLTHDADHKRTSRLTSPDLLSRAKTGYDS